MALGAVAVVGISPHLTEQPRLAPYISHNASKLILDSYIVKLKENYTLEHHLERTQLNISLLGHEHYNLDTLPGYYLRGNQSLINIVKSDVGVEWVEQSSYFYLPNSSPTIGYKMSLEKRWTSKTAQDASFQLAMQSSKEKLSRRRNIDSYEYRYWSEAGSNVDIYVLDSGVNIHHPEFGGRAFNFKGLDFSPYIRPDMDPDGTERTMMDTTPATHGTCIASLAAGNTFGTAKRANIINVKVGTKIGGNTIEIARAIFDVTKIHNQRKLLNRLSPFAGSVISLSMSGGFDRAVEIAIKRAVYAGIPVVVPAGDTNSDASTAFPCNMTEVICVAAVDERYRKTNTSNYGPDVTLAAPGQDTWCATFQGNSFNSYRFGSIFIPSGTSLAVPYVSGTLSLFISYEKIRDETSTVWRRMAKNWNVGFLGSFPESPETPNRFNSNGFRYSFSPYYGAPSDPDP